MHKSRIPFLCTILSSFLGTQIKNSLSLHQPRRSSLCTNQEISFSAPASPLFFVHKSRNLVLCTILSSFLGALIKKSLPLHHPQLFSWCTNQEISFSTPASALFLVHGLRNLVLCTILSSSLGALIKKSLPLHHPQLFSWCTNQEFSSSAPASALFLVYKSRILFLCTTHQNSPNRNTSKKHNKTTKQQKQQNHPKTNQHNKKPPAGSQAFLKLRSRRVVFFILIRPVSYDSSYISFRIHMDMDHLDKSSLQSVPLAHWLQIHLCWYL